MTTKLKSPAIFFVKTENVIKVLIISVQTVMAHSVPSFMYYPVLSRFSVPYLSLYNSINHFKRFQEGPESREIEESKKF